MQKTSIIFSALFFLTTAVFGQQEATTVNGRKVFLYNDGHWIYKDSLPIIPASSPGVEKREIPLLKPGEKVICHTGYCFSYYEAFEQSKWVAYELTKEETSAQVERSNKFMPDPEVTSGTANDRDYQNSGFDRGHLAPAADMEWSPKAMAESFYYSNMSPQEPGFNRGIWKKLEEQVRAWAVDYDTVYVVTGPILREGLPTIGPDKVAVPEYFYKVILNYSATGKKGIGFILANKNSSKSLQQFAVSIDSVERFSGIDFFPALPAEQINKIESNCDISNWKWNSTVR